MSFNNGLIGVLACVIIGGAACVLVRIALQAWLPGDRQALDHRRPGLPGRLKQARGDVGWGLALIPVATAYLWAFASFSSDLTLDGGLGDLFGVTSIGGALGWTLVTMLAVGTGTALAPRRAGYLAAVCASGLGLYLLYECVVFPPSVYDAEWYGWARDGVGQPWLVALSSAFLVCGFSLTRRTIVADIRARERQLTARVDRLTETRTGAVDSAAAELRRLERDLHDGAQARLVALGINLRTAEKLVKSSPDVAVALVAECRDTATLALAELRDLVRGIYPPVLADRGLADAIEALALDCPVPAVTDIRLGGRPPAPVESAVYFAVAEALSNAAKHAQAGSVFVRVAHDGRLLRAEVHDDGTGGADLARGTGLAGIEQRLAAFDGILAISSPAGGPTIIVIEVPCDLSSLKTSTS